MLHVPPELDRMQRGGGRNEIILCSNLINLLSYHK